MLHLKLLYSKDLDFLFVTHRVSDDLKKKYAAVRCLGITVVLSFDNLASSYEDFKGEVIPGQMYPEASPKKKASPEQQYTISGLQRLVSDHAHTQIYSDQELSKYYREFLLISRNLITTRGIGVQEQEY